MTKHWSPLLRITLNDGEVIERSSGAWGRPALGNNSSDPVSFSIAPDGSLIIRQYDRDKEAFAPGEWKRVTWAEEEWDNEA